MATTKETARAILFHDQYRIVESQVRGGSTKRAAIIAMRERIDGQPLIGELPNGETTVLEDAIKAGSITHLQTKYKLWRESGRCFQCLLRNYTGRKNSVARLFKAEWHRRLCQTTGGRNKHGAAMNGRHCYETLERDWKAGTSIRGLGTWQDWWAKTQGTELPPVPPDFPYDYSTMMKHKPPKASASISQVGFAAAKKDLPQLFRRYDNLKRAELYTLDDVRLDIAALDPFTGDVTTVVSYIMMEVASRSIASIISMPQEQPESRQVDQLLIAGLAAYGVGDGHTTHILFERGTVACSERAQEQVEAVYPGMIKIHRTSMIAGEKLPSIGLDRPTGNSRGKAVIESFNRKLHTALLSYETEPGQWSPTPGQRGNNFGNQPANLGVGSFAPSTAPTETKSGKRKPVRRQNIYGGSIADAAQKLAQIDFLGKKLGLDHKPDPTHRTSIHLPMLTVQQVIVAAQRACALHNQTVGRDYTGHGKFTEVEIRPNTWVPIDQLDEVA